MGPAVVFDQPYSDASKQEAPLVKTPVKIPNENENNQYRFSLCKR